MARARSSTGRALADRGIGRSHVGLALVLALLLVLGVRLVWVQGLDVGGRAESAAAERSRTETVPALRGEIRDADGNVLARTLQRYDVTVDQTLVREFQRPRADGTSETVTPTQAVYRLADALDLPDTEVKDALDGDEKFAYVARGVTPEQWNAVREIGLPYVYGQPTSDRIYPDGPLAGSVVGFMGGDQEALGGIEQSMDEVLSGTDGRRTYEISADGVRIPVAPTEETPVEDGSSVRLSLDSEVQFFAQEAVTARAQELDAEWGSAVVMRISDGAVLALADSSTVDPNDPGAAEAEDLAARSVTQAVEPGSTQKILTAAAAVEEGLVTPHTEITVPPFLEIDGEKITDAFDHGEQDRTFAGIIADSMNTGTVMVGSKLTPQQRHDWMARFGVGEATGIELPGESPGILAPADQWDPRQQYTVLFGQGVAQTPLRTATIFQAIGNGGVQVEPRVVDAVIGPDGTENAVERPEGERIVSEETAQQVLDMMEVTVTRGGAKEAAVEGYRVGGKTGTAEAPSAEGGYDGYTTSFVGVAPIEDPQYLVAVTMQRPEGDVRTIGTTATFSTIMGQVLRHYGVPPSTTEPVEIPLRTDVDEDDPEAGEDAAAGAQEPAGDGDPAGQQPGADPAPAGAADRSASRPVDEDG
ncbi:penicillin-binding protein 2 [Kocuria sp. LUK]|uniref:peptidoglycan D,D-transpeptidase FtsI family protein n=1 Tax=Kocuria sp. LUK TaxID=2897828 RepID=UPI001E375359|nr:penicillin-binding protein 2 [Kocuria sp. LUK]MCD1144132.1 penicillin-binding protein 2 [Kocuria sp. LUK]